MLFLNKEDVFKSITYKGMMEAVEDGYKAYEEEKFSMPLRVHEDIGDNTLLLMPCVNEKGFGTKILSLFPQNVEKGKPYIDGIMVLHCIESGEITAIMDAKAVTALRTGAVGGVAIDYLSPKEANSVGVIGAGVQGYYQAIFASNIRRLKTIQIFDQRIEGLGCFAKRLENEITYPVEINICNTVDELLNNSEIVVTTTTSNNPVIPDKVDYIKNKCFIGIGSYKPNMREYPEAVFKHCDKIFVDTKHAFSETGDLITPINKGWICKNDIKMFSTFIQSTDKERYNTVLFKSVGMALFDLFAAQKIVEVAEKNNVGQNIIV